MSVSSPSQITFPPGALGAASARLPVAGQGTGWLALAKPPEIAFGRDELAPAAMDLHAALQAALDAGKAQLQALGVSHVGTVHRVDTAASGVVVFATAKESESRLRNAMGSGQWEFVYELVAGPSRTRSLEATSLVCDLPVGRHATELRVHVSHASGKKCETRFTRLQTLGAWSRWEARTRENRPHQVRLHAWESGLPIPGDNLYGQVPRVYLSQIKRGYRPGRETERPLHPFLALHLREITFPGETGEAVHVSAARPKSFDVLVRRLAEAAGPAGSRR